MTDEPALLAAIAARPDDDTPRLVYADWLDDHGQGERAEFIRLQCLLARDELDDPAAERADELENAHRVRWLAGVPTGPGLRWSFDRGFPERLEADAHLVADWYDRVAAVPWLRDLCLTNLTYLAARALVGRPWPPGWVELEVGAPPDPLFAGEGERVWTVRALASSPRLRQLRALRLSWLRLSAESVAALAESPHLDGLRLLGVPGDPDRPLYAPLRARFGDRLAGEGA